MLLGNYDATYERVIYTNHGYTELTINNNKLFSFLREFSHNFNALRIEKLKKHILTTLNKSLTMPTYFFKL